MRTVCLPAQFFLFGCALVFGDTAGGWAGEQPRPLAGSGHAAGVVTGIVGAPVTIVATAPTSSRTLKVGDVIAAGDELRVGTDEKLDVLWDHRAVLTLREVARMHIHELHHGQTEVRLHHGRVRIALSYNAGRMTDTLTLQTPMARVVSRGGILEAIVLEGEQRALFSRLINTHPVETLRVFEGQARVEPLTGEGKPFSLKAGAEVSLKGGTVNAVLETKPDQPALSPLAVREEHRALPSPVTRQIASAQIGAALELEKGLHQATHARNAEDNRGATIKGAILSTSTGLPFIPGIQASATGNSAGVPSLSTSSPSILFPPVAPSVQSAGAGSLGPAQSGGLNSSGLLQHILNDVGKGGKGHGKRER